MKIKYKNEDYYKSIYSCHLLDKIFTFYSLTIFTPIDMQEFERKTDRLVYKLYDLTEEKIRIVEK